MLQQLKDRITNAKTTALGGGEKLLITTVETEAPAVHDLWDIAIEQANLEVDKVVILDNINNGYLLVNGNITIKGVVYNINLAFYENITPQELACIMIASPVDNWNLLLLYPDLPPFSSQGAVLTPQTSFLKDINLHDARLVIASHNNTVTNPPTDLSRIIAALPFVTDSIAEQSAAIVYGLNVFGSPFLEGDLAFANSIIDNHPLKSLHGFLVRDRSFDNIHLFFPVEASKSIGNFTAAFEGFEVYSSTTNHILAEKGLILYGLIKTGNIEFYISGEIPIGGNVITFEGYLPNGLSIKDFTHLNALTNSPEIGSHLPIAVEILENISLHSVALGLNISSPGIQFFEFSLGVDNQYDLIPGIILLKDIKFTGRVDQPFPSGQSKREYYIEMSAGWELDGARIDTVLTLPNVSMSGRLAPGNRLGLISLFKKFFPGLPFDKEIWVLDLEVFASKAGDYSCFVELADVWSIELDSIVIAMKSLILNIEGEKGIGASGFIQGIFEIGAVSFLARAAVPSAGGGWIFSGNTGAGEEIPIGIFLEELQKKFNTEKSLPEPLQTFSIKNINVSFDTQTKHFIFGCEGDFLVEGKNVAILLNINVIKQDISYKKDFGGQISVGPFDTLGTLQFDLHFIQDSDSTLFAATYIHKGGSSNISLKALLAHFSDDIADIPVDLTVDLKDIILVFEKKPNVPTKFLFALDISASLNLSKLPLVGKEFPPDKSVGVDNLQFILANAPIAQKEVQTWANQQLLPPEVTPMPVRDLNEGLSIDGKLNLGGFEQPIALPIAGSNTPPAGINPSPNQNVTPPTSPDKAKWFTLQKQVGPIYFERIGVQYEKGELWFLLDASLTAAGLTIALQGLSVGSSLKKFDPVFRLNGLGIDFKRGPLEIGGAFLRFGDFEYAGTAIIKTKALTLAAIGSYAELKDGHKSMFIYAVLDYPLGGPAFFFVTGLAAGFGYNRRLRIPAIDQVANFPLVSEAVNGVSPIPTGAGQRNALLGELTKIQNYIPPETGQYFLAVGIKFNSFKLIDSFALLTIAFGNQFEMDLLGLSTLVVPTPEAGQTIDPLAEVQMAIKVSFIPDDGFLGVEAQLTAASFLLSRKCHLTGGFAFYSWFEGVHKGDFVISVGGYHPNYQVPAHYPKVPRLGFNWQVTNQLSLKGEAYFALTSSAIMAGGRLEALWLDGNLKAWFIIGADFIIAWKPYHYEARIYVDMGVAYTFSFFGTHTISVDVGADLHIWGPDFSGTAHVKLWIITFDVTFGSGASQAPTPIDWTTFRTSFLPASDEDMASISLINGIKMQPDIASGVDWIVDVKNFEFEINTLIPIKRGVSSEGNKTFGIAPMDLKSEQVDSSLQINIKKKSNNPNIPDADVRAAFKFEPILKNMPTGMWGTSVSPSLNGQKFIEAALTGYRIKLNKQEKEPTDKPNPIDVHKFQFTPTSVNNYIQLKELPRFQPQDVSDWKAQLKKHLLINNQRDTLLNALGFSTATDVHLTDTFIDELTMTPQFSS